jgi:hypothetical protein
MVVLFDLLKTISTKMGGPKNVNGYKLQEDG